MFRLLYYTSNFRFYAFRAFFYVRRFFGAKFYVSWVCVDACLCLLLFLAISRCGSKRKLRTNFHSFHHFVRFYMRAKPTWLLSLSLTRNVIARNANLARRRKKCNFHFFFFSRLNYWWKIGFLFISVLNCVVRTFRWSRLAPKNEMV